VKGAVVHRPVQTARMIGKDLELSFDDPRPKATPDIFLAHCAQPNRIEVAYQGVPTSPFEFKRSGTAPLSLGP